MWSHNMFHELRVDCRLTERVQNDASEIELPINHQAWLSILDITEYLIKAESMPKM